MSESARPRRIQLKRTKGWRIRQAVSVARPTKWGNPFTFDLYRADYPEDDDRALRFMATSDFRHTLEGRPDFEWPEGTTYPSVEEIRRSLRGRDLACWCPLDHDCHADVLLEVANA